MPFLVKAAKALLLVAVLLANTVASVSNVEDVLEKWGSLLKPSLQQDYSLVRCNASLADGGSNVPSWCLWQDPPESARRLEVSNYDDSPVHVTDDVIETTVPLLSVPDVNRGRESRSYVTSNGFLSLTPYLPCTYFCFGTVRWPSVSLYEDDLDPSACSQFNPQVTTRVGGNETPCGIYATNDTVWFMGIPLYDQAPGPTLTASLTLTGDGDVVMRYVRVPQFGTAPAFVGITMGDLQKVFFPTIEIQLLAGSALKFSRLADVNESGQGPTPNQTICRGASTCSECVSRGLELGNGPVCSWCGGLKGSTGAPDGLCFHTSVAPDFCTSESSISSPGECDRDSLQQITTSGTSSDPTYGFYRARMEAVASASAHPSSHMQGAQVLFGEKVTVTLPFSVPTFDGRSPTPGQRCFEMAVVQMNGRIELCSKSAPSVHAHVDVLYRSDLLIHPNRVLWSRVSYTVLAGNRPISSTICGNRSLGTCGPALYVRYDGVQLCSPMTTHACRLHGLFSASVAIHQDGNVDFWYDFAGDKELAPVTNVSVPPVQVVVNAVDASLPAELFPASPGFTFGILVEDVLMPENTAAFRLPWTAIGQGQRWRLERLRRCPQCLHGGKCNNVTLQCECNPHGLFEGVQCERCMPGYYVVRGKNGGDSTCVQCPSCANNGTCDQSGACVCLVPFSGARCEIRCRDPNRVTCAKCTPGNGYCVCGKCHCLDGFEGPSCDKPVEESNNVVLQHILLGIFYGIAVIVVIVVMGLLARRGCRHYNMVLIRHSRSHLASDVTQGNALLSVSQEGDGPPITPQPRPPNMHLMSRFGSGSNQAAMSRLNNPLSPPTDASSEQNDTGDGDTELTML